MSSIEVEEAVTKLRSLSEERAIEVLSLIEDLAELEVLENAEDLKDARAALAEMQGKTAVSVGARL
jgi:Mg/Co/Ni transporter MgtE